MSNQIEKEKIEILEHDSRNVKESELFTDIVRAVKFTEAQCSMSDYQRREQWKMEQKQHEITNQTFDMCNRVMDTFGRVSSVQRYIFLLFLLQCILLLLFLLALCQQFGIIEQLIQQLLGHPISLATIAAFSKEAFA